MPCANEDIKNAILFEQIIDKLKSNDDILTKNFIKILKSILDKENRQKARRVIN